MIILKVPGETRLKRTEAHIIFLKKKNSDMR